jgi:heme/copper-type cytochrome/quinol oxidase subunit 1
MKLKGRPYHLLFIAAILVLIASFFTMNETMDIHLHDTYYVISAAWTYWAIVVLLLVLWLIYVFTNRFLLSKPLTWIHVVLTIVLALLLTVFVFNPDRGSAGMARDYTDWSAFDEFERYNRMITYALLLLPLGLLLYIINLVGGLIKRSRTPR